MNSETDEMLVCCGLGRGLLKRSTLLSLERYRHAPPLASSKSLGDGHVLVLDNRHRE